MINLQTTFIFFFTASLMVLSSCSSVSVETEDNFEVVELPDGSLAFLNHNSAVDYDKEFSPRTLEVQGEVFLSVVEGESPFVVKSQNGEITVLGTEFNVRSQAEQLEVEVEEGIVELKTKTHSEKVKRGQAIVYNTAENEFKKVKAEFKFRIWMKELKDEFKKLGKEIKDNSEEIGKESKKAGNQLKKELKKLR
ncbi:MAG TPA: FecR domain-containing protein [Chryseolinea sp.]|nr:FecR domain-containing protein [Chryseolinea sp.]